MVRPLDVKKLHTLRRIPRDGARNDPDEVVFLHSLLNHHLPAPDDQLPVQGPGASDFGPRTEAKVKRFQEANKIDFNTPDFKDGVVGPHTWAVLAIPEKQAVVVVTPTPSLTPPTIPPVIPRPQPPVIPVPKLTLGVDFQLQIGQQITIPFDSDPVTLARQIQLVAVFLDRRNQENFHVEVQAGPQIAFNSPAGPNDSKTDLGFVAVLNFANLPGSGDSFTWSAAAQLALIKSLSNPLPPGLQSSGLVQGNISVLKRGGRDVVQLTGQAGILLEADAPTKEINRWTWKSGGILFFGATGTFSAF
jgi:hypothetical protein